jgi:hypothetical protein
MKDDAKRVFLKNEIMLLTLNAGLATRDSDAKIYCPEASNTRKEDLKSDIRQKLAELAASYIERKVSEDEHIANIRGIADYLTEKFSDCLDRSRFRIGVSQKLLNLYLKYLWTLGWIPEPCHCPFDRIVIEKLGDLPAAARKWTSLDSIDDYKALVKEAKEIAKRERYSSLAVWELETYERRRKKLALDG